MRFECSFARGVNCLPNRSMLHASARNACRPFFSQGKQEAFSLEWQKYRLAFHTSSQELGTIAAKAKPGLLILYHRGNVGCDQMRASSCREAGDEEHLLKEVRQAYSGKVVAAHDLDLY